MKTDSDIPDIISLSELSKVKIGRGRVEGMKIACSATINPCPGDVASYSRGDLIG